MAITKKILGQSNPSAATLTDVYTAPNPAVISTFVVANRSATPTSFRLAVAPGGAADDPKHYLAFDADIGAHEIWTWTIGATLAATDVVRYYSTLATTSLNIFGAEES